VHSEHLCVSHGSTLSLTRVSPETIIADLPPTSLHVSATLVVLRPTDSTQPLVVYSPATSTVSLHVYAHQQICLLHSLTVRTSISYLDIELDLAFSATSLALGADGQDTSPASPTLCCIAAHAPTAGLLFLDDKGHISSLRTGPDALPRLAPRGRIDWAAQTPALSDAHRAVSFVMFHSFVLLLQGQSLRVFLLSSGEEIEAIPVPAAAVR
jgi:hypothetical protein